MDFKEAIQSLEKREIMPERPPALEQTLKGLDRIGLSPASIPQILNNQLDRVILIAGTNGKGSVAATLEQLFISTGEKPGLFTSPHLTSYTERIRVGGKNIDAALFTNTYALVDEKTKDLGLSHFEVLTLMAAWIFFSGQCGPIVDRAVFEVGLGGTWDSTNAIPHGVSVITTIGHDHQHILGNSLAQIAENKFGIVREGNQVFLGNLPPEAKEVQEVIQKSTSARWTTARQADFRVKPGPVFEILTPWGPQEVQIPGARGIENTALALTVFEGLGFSPSEHLRALKNVMWRGRMERIEGKDFPCPVYLSGDHNPEGIESLVKLLEYYPRKHLWILAGVGKRKPLDGILGPLFSISNSSVFLTETPFQGRSLQDYQSWREKAVGAEPDPQIALERIREKASKEDIVLVTGSIYLVGDILASFS